MKTQLTKRIAGVMLVMAMIATLCAFGAMTVSAVDPVKQNTLSGPYEVGTAGSSAGIIQLDSTEVKIGTADGAAVVSDASKTTALGKVIDALEDGDIITLEAGKITEVELNKSSAAAYDFTTLTGGELKNSVVKFGTIVGTFKLGSSLKFEEDYAVLSLLKSGDIVTFAASAEISKIDITATSGSYDLSAFAEFEKFVSGSAALDMSGVNTTATVKLVVGDDEKGLFVLDTSSLTNSALVHDMLEPGDIMTLKGAGASGVKTSALTLKGEADYDFTGKTTAGVADVLDGAKITVAIGSENTAKFEVVEAYATAAASKTGYGSIVNANTTVLGSLKAGTANDTFTVDNTGKIIAVALNSDVHATTTTDLSASKFITAFNGIEITIGDDVVKVTLPQQLINTDTKFTGYDKFSTIIDALRPSDTIVIEAGKLSTITLKDSSYDYALANEEFADAVLNTGFNTNKGAKITVSKAKSVTLPKALAKTDNYAGLIDATYGAATTAITGKLGTEDSFTVNGSNKMTSITLYGDVDISSGVTAAQIKGIEIKNGSTDEIKLTPAADQEITLGGTNPIKFDIKGLATTKTITVKHNAATPVSYELVKPTTAGSGDPKFISASVSNGFTAWPANGGSVTAGKKVGVASNVINAANFDYTFEISDAAAKLGATTSFEDGIAKIEGAAKTTVKVTAKTTQAYTISGTITDAVKKTTGIAAKVDIYLASDYNAAKGNTDAIEPVASQVTASTAGVYTIPDIVAGDYMLVAKKEGDPGFTPDNYLPTPIAVTVSDSKATTAKVITANISMQPDMVAQFLRTHEVVLKLTTSSVKIGNKAIIDAALKDFETLTSANKDRLTTQKGLLDDLAAKIPDLEAKDAADMIKAGLTKVYVDENAIVRASTIVASKYSGYTVTLTNSSDKTIVAEKGEALKQGSSTVTFGVAKTVDGTETTASTGAYSINVTTVLNYASESVLAAGSNPDAIIDLTNESLELPMVTDEAGNEAEYKILSYSIDGGEKWKNAKGDTFSDANFAKLLKKDINLQIADKAIDKSTKKPAEGANIITFPSIKKRPKLDKYVINYSIYPDESGVTAGWWVLTTKGGTTPLKTDIEVAVADGKNPSDDGYGKFYDVTAPTATQDPGIPVLATAKTVYFVRSAAKVEADGSYTAASAPKKFTAVGLQKAPKYKVAKGGVSYKAGTWIADGAKTPVLKTAKGAFTSTTATTIDVWMAATEKKPASAKQTLTVPASN